MFRLRIAGFIGGETRLSWCRMPSPRKNYLEPPGQEIDTNVSSLPRGPSLSSALGQAPPLVNRFDSEDARQAGVSGFGLIPRPTSFGLKARRQVKRLSVALDGLAKAPREVIFFTGTLPGSTTESMLALSQWSGFVVHRLKSWIHDIDRSYSSVFCWEWQKRGALHLHMAVYVKDNVKRNEVYNGFKARWIDLLEQVCERSGHDVFARGANKGTWRGHFDKIRARAEWVKKSVASYLGKYLSKASGPIKDKSKFFYPSRWWGSTQNLKEIEKAARVNHEYFYLLRGEVESKYLDLRPFMELFSEWSTGYGHKVVEGETSVSYGLERNRLKEIIRSFLPMRDIQENVALDDVVAEAVALWGVLLDEHPVWMERLALQGDGPRRMSRYVGGEEKGIVEDREDLYRLCLTSFWFLRDDAARNKRYGGKYLPYRASVSVRSTYNRLEACIEAWEAQNVFHELQDVAYPGRKL